MWVKFKVQSSKFKVSSKVLLYLLLSLTFELRTCVVGAFAQNNPTQFNRADGKGYDFVVEKVLALDDKNPQVAARLLSAFKSWRVLESFRRTLAQAALQRVAAVPTLSRDVNDIVQRTLAEPA